MNKFQRRSFLGGLVGSLLGWAGLSQARPTTPKITTAGAYELTPTEFTPGTMVPGSIYGEFRIPEAWIFLRNGDAINAPYYRAGATGIRIWYSQPISHYKDHGKACFMTAGRLEVTCDIATLCAPLAAIQLALADWAVVPDGPRQSLTLHAEHPKKESYRLPDPILVSVGEGLTFDRKQPFGSGQQSLCILRQLIFKASDLETNAAQLQSSPQADFALPFCVIDKDAGVARTVRELLHHRWLGDKDASADGLAFRERLHNCGRSDKPAAS